MNTVLVVSGTRWMDGDIPAAGVRFERVRRPAQKSATLRRVRRRNHPLRFNWLFVPGFHLLKRFKQRHQIDYFVGCAFQPGAQRLSGCGYFDTNPTAPELQC
jgi:hypothetical protein